jgi:hypothetical protein
MENSVAVPKMMIRIIQKKFLFLFTVFAVFRRGEEKNCEIFSFMGVSYSYLPLFIPPPPRDM